MLEKLKEMKDEMMSNGLSLYLEKTNAYAKQYALLKRKAEEYKGILERMVEEKAAIQIFRGMPSEVNYKCKYFEDAVSENMYEFDSMKIGKVFFIDKPNVVDGHNETIACISYSYLWLKEGYTEDYYEKVFEEWESAKEERDLFFMENKRYLLLQSA